jgi:hypothetical protein
MLGGALDQVRHQRKAPRITYFVNLLDCNLIQRRVHPLADRGWPMSRGWRTGETNDAKNAADWQFTEPFPLMSTLSRQLWAEMLAFVFETFSYTYIVSILADTATSRSCSEVK